AGPARARREAQPRVVIPGPAPAHFRSPLVLPAVAAGAAADPHGRGARVKRAPGGALARAHTHEAFPGLERVGLLEQPADPLRNRQRRPAPPAELRVGVGRRPT